MRPTAKSWLRERLSDCQGHLSTEVLDEGEAVGFCRSTLLKARQELPITSHYESGKWVGKLAARAERTGKITPRAVLWVLDKNQLKPTLEERVEDLVSRSNEQLACIEELQDQVYELKKRTEFLE